MKQKTKFLITILFIFSGLTSLVYESLWIRTLGLSLGSTSTSMSLVLSIFFFGMSVGSYLSSRFIHKISNPLKTYGYVEGFIGLYSFGLIYVLISLSNIVSYLPGTNSSSLIALSAKALIVLIILGPPSIAMGTTLPLLIKTLSDNNTSVGKNVSFLYGINTLGAVLGAFSTGFLFIPRWGVLGSNHMMVVLNLVILFSCLFIAKQMTTNHFKSDAIPTNSLITFNKTQKTIIVSTGLVGFASIGSEVIWNKYLSLFLGTNIFGLSLVLAIFLLGIALGSFALSKGFEKIKNPMSFYINLLIATLFAIVLGTWGLNAAPVAAHIFNYYFTSLDLLTVKTVIVALILLVPTSLFGALLPLAVSILTTENDKAPAITGRVYAVNTWGAILGSAVTGLIFIPQFGSAVSLTLLNVFLLMALALVILSQIEIKSYLRPTIKWALTAFFVFWFPSVNFENIIKSAYFSYITPGQSFNDVTRFFAKDFEKIIYLEEGKTAIMSLNYEVNNNGELNTRQLRMKTNGLNESYFDRDYLEVIPKYEALLGLIPYLHHKKPQSAFIVGYGGGYTTDLLTSLPLELVHVAEIEDKVLKVSDFIHEGNNPILKRPNLKLDIEDARFVLNSKKHGPYDIIVSQPSHSWISGVANLFTHEFFEMAKGNLTEDGLFAQWLNLYNMDEGSLKSILSTYYKTFPHGAVFTDQNDYQVILLGSQKPLKLNWERLNEIASDSQWQHRLSFVPINSAADFLSNFSMGRDKVVAATLGAPLNTDENAYAEIRQSRRFYSIKSEEQAAQPFFSDNFDENLFKVLNISQPNQAELLSKMLKSYGDLNKYDKYFKSIQSFEKLAKNKAHYQNALAEACNGIERIHCAVDAYTKDFNQSPSKSKLLSLLSLLNQNEMYRESLKVYTKYRRYVDETHKCFKWEAKVFLGQKIDLKMLQSPKKLISLCGNFAKPMVARILINQGKAEESISILDSLLKDNFENIRSLTLMIEAQMKAKKLASVSYYSDILNTQRQSEVERLKNLAEYYSDMGWLKDSEFLENKLRSLEL